MIEQWLEKPTTYVVKANAAFRKFYYQEDESGVVTDPTGSTARMVAQRVAADGSTTVLFDVSTSDHITVTTQVVNGVSKAGFLINVPGPTIASTGRFSFDFKRTPSTGANDAEYWDAGDIIVEASETP